MKKIVIFALTVLVCLSMLASCAQNTFLNREGGLYDEKEDVQYSYAPLCVEAIAYAGTAHIVDSYGYSYHSVRDMEGNDCDASQLLYDPEGQTLIYNSSMKFPTILEFEANRAAFYYPGERDQLLEAIDDTAEAVRLTNVFKNPTISYTANTAADTYHIRFFSEKYPYFSYVYTYIEYSQDQIVDVKVTSLDGYTFIDGLPHEETQNADGSYTVSYNYGKYFVLDRDSRLCYMAGYIHDKYNTVES